MRTDEALVYVEAGQLDAEFQKLYETDVEVAQQRQRYVDAIRKFEEYFGQDAVAIFRAPGRTEIGGNHTDHQHGEVLAAAIHLDMIAIVSKCEDACVEIVSEGFQKISLSIQNISINEAEQGTSAALVKGVLSGCKERGYRIGGFKAYMTSSIPPGAGLSSSAAYETLIASIVSGLYNEMRIDPVDVAKIGQHAENVYFGKPCGLMDQMACAIGNMVHIDFADPDNPETEVLECDLSKLGYSLCITDTQGSHADLTEDYAAVPAEMHAVAACFGKEVLHDISQEQLYERMKEIRETCGDRAFLRAWHFFEENKRVRKEVEAVKSGQMELFLQQVQASGDSSYKYLQNIYSNADIKRQNIAFALALSEAQLLDHGVSRVHGGGFAGTIQSFVKKEYADDFRDDMNAIFGEKSCIELQICKYGGRKLLDESEVITN